MQTFSFRKLQQAPQHFLQLGPFPLLFEINFAGTIVNSTKSTLIFIECTTVIILILCIFLSISYDRAPVQNKIAAKSFPSFRTMTEMKIPAIGVEG